MNDQGITLLLIGFLMLGCIASSKISVRFSIPCLMLFLLIGLGLKYTLRYFGFYGDIDWMNANRIGSIALCYILFSGGFDSSLKDISKVRTCGTVMATLGVLLTALLLGLFAFAITRPLVPTYLRRILFCQCLLFGAIISSTDASAVFSILRSKSISLSGNIKPMLEYESGSNDPMATFLTLFFLNICVNHRVGNSPLFFLPGFAWQIIGGSLLGYILAKTALWLFNHIGLDYDGMYHVLGMGLVLIIYALTTLLQANGFMAVYIAGIIMGNSRFIFHNSFGRFCDALAWLMQVVLFTLLGYKAVWRNLVDVWPWALLLALFLMFIARPAATYLSLWKSQFGPRAKLLISWVGLRGGAPIMLATFPMLYSDKLALVGSRGQELMSASFIFHVVFFMVLLSVICQSFTIMPLARKLHLDTPLDIIPAPPITFEQVSYQDKGRTGETNRLSDNLSDCIPRDFTIPNDFASSGTTLRELGLPRGAFVVMVRRGGKYIIPQGQTTIEKGDTLTVMASSALIEQTAAVLGCQENG